MAGISAAVAMAVSACQPPSPGNACGDGWCRDDMTCEIASVDRAPPREMCVIHGVCGNGVRDPGEVCDDGNTISGDGCASDCQSDETCGNGKTDNAAGETCDPPVLGQCSLDCRLVATCGNGRVDSGEACDYGAGNNNNGDCRTDCVYNQCGDGQRNIIGTHAEDCDDGMTDPSNKFNVIPMESSGCNLDCTTPRCGDGKLNRHFIVEAVSAPEQCDEGEHPSQDCQYGRTFCVVCDSNCQQAPGQVHVCGDGFVDAPNEVCDHGNKSCGSCSANCQAMALASATGSIRAAPASEYQGPGDEFQISDGLVAVTFAITTNPDGSRVPIVPAPDDTDVIMAGKIAGAINGQQMPGLHIQATANGNLVMLANLRQTAAGNQTIVTTITAPSFHVQGMAGGAGANCAAGQTCHDDSDCLPTLVCSDSDHMCTTPH
jgi:cysteine-rich repeat protein